MSFFRVIFPEEMALFLQESVKKSQENNCFDFSNKAQACDFVQSFKCDW